ncbi:MAG: AAA family ATPase [Candidatus Buchananbacteria bacterium]|jgi:wobble nucleotide-excising tRNase
MKIQKVKKINHARFHNYSWDSSLGDFADGVNLLFGWNGSGKTTFSKVLHCLESGIVESGCTFKIKTDSSQITDTSNLDLVKGNIRILNGSYIEETLRGSITIPYIFFAGVEAVSYDLEEQKLKEKKMNMLK